MTRKNYIVFADILKFYKENAPLMSSDVVVDRITREIADACYKDNHNFDYNKFFEAAGHKV